jgi:ribosomal RNA methyltransferase Nop2
MPGKNRKRTNHPPPSPSSSSEETSSERLSSEEEENYDDYNRNNDDLIADEYDHQSSDIDSDDEEDALDRVQGFTDENAEWLKRKRTADRRGKHKLLDSSSEDDGDDDVTDPDQDDNYDMEEQGLLEIERQSKFLDEQMEREYEEAEEELQQTMKDNSATFHLPTAEELELEETQRVVIPPTELRTRIDSILHVLADFRALKEPTRSRKEYLQQLNCDMAELFGYLPELVEYFLSIFGPAETLEFLSASDSPRPLVIRTNTIKVRRKDLAAALIKRGVSLDPLATWTKVGLKITSSTIPIGATPEYLSGHYMLQSAASLCPVMALDPQQQERILDMSAAPGGKTSYIAQLMRNTGTIIANDLKPDRQKATIANLHRLGVRNVITCSNDGRKLGSLWKNKFDRILLDAPCSGLGVISRDPSVKVQRTMKDIERCAVLQKELLLSAIDALNHNGKSKGIMVYSTCSVSVAENEEVVNYLLRKRHVKIVDTGLDFGRSFIDSYDHKSNLFRIHNSCLRN